MNHPDSVVARIGDKKAGTVGADGHAVWMFEKSRWKIAVAKTLGAFTRHQSHSIGHGAQGPCDLGSQNTQTDNRKKPLIKSETFAELNPTPEMNSGMWFHELSLSFSTVKYRFKADGINMKKTLFPRIIRKQVADIKTLNRRRKQTLLKRLGGNHFAGIIIGFRPSQRQ